MCAALNSTVTTGMVSSSHYKDGRTELCHGTADAEPPSPSTLSGR